MKSFLRYVICLFLAAPSPIMFAQTVVRVVPPAPVRVGVVGRPPHPGYVWTEGYQRWNGTRYVWVSGRWLRPPLPGAVWVAPVWGGGETDGYFAQVIGGDQRSRCARRSS